VAASISHGNPTGPVSVADRARRAAAMIDRVADATRGKDSAARQIGIGPSLQLKDEIGYDLLYVADWLKRRRGIGEAEALLSEMHTVLAAMDRPQETTAEGALILDLFPRARLFAWGLRNWANDIDAEDRQRQQRIAGGDDGEQGAPDQSRPTYSLQDLLSLLEVFGDSNAVQMAAVAQDTSKSTEDRMQAIYEIDRRVLGWDSPKWAKVLGVTEAAIRKNHWWREERTRLSRDH
jgi:hypothetical protein